jgi:putative transposase
MGRHVQVRLSEAEHEQLSKLVRSGSSSARTLTRARILLLADRERQAKRGYEEIAQAVLCSVSTVGSICRRYAQEGLEAALREKARPGAVPKLTGDIEAKLVMLACSEAPEGRGRWTLRLLAKRMVELAYVESISNVAVYKRLKKTTLNLGRSSRGV